MPLIMKANSLPAPEILPAWSTMTPMDPLAVPERLMTSVRALGPAGSRWLEDLPGILASLAADWSIGYGRPLDGGNAAYVIEAVTADGRPVVAKLALPPGWTGLLPSSRSWKPSGSPEVTPMPS